MSTKTETPNGNVGRIRIVAAIHLGAVPEIRRANQIGNAFLHPLGVEGRAPDMGRDLIDVQNREYSAISAVPDAPQRQ